MSPGIRRESNVRADHPAPFTCFAAKSPRKPLGRIRWKQRLDYAKLAPDAMRALYSLGAYLAKCGLEHPLLELVKIRASQINGCAYCIDMHTKDARAAGETERRIYALNAWRETPFFSDRERAALAWTEAVTRIGDGRAPMPCSPRRGGSSPRRSSRT